MPSIFDGVPRGDPSREERDYTAPAAQFLDPAALNAPEFDFPNDPRKNPVGFLNRRFQQSARLFLGVTGGNVRSTGPFRCVQGGRAVGYLDDRHVVTIAGSRAGKGRSALVPNLLSYPGSMIVNDPKGELANLTAQHRAERMGQKVYVLDPFCITHGATAKYRASFNFIRTMRMSSIVEDAALVTDAFIIPSDREPHWDESSRPIADGTTILTAGDPAFKGRRSMATVYELLSRGAVGPDGKHSMDALRTLMERCEVGNGAVQAAAADFFDRPPNERGSVLSTVRRHFRVLSYPPIQSVVQGHDFDLDVLKREAATIYLCLPARHARTCARWLRAFVNQTLQVMETCTEKPVTGLPVILALDEFSGLGRMNQVESAAAQIAGFDVKLWVVLQDLSQLKSTYPDSWETFLGNAGVLQFFGNTDLTTLDWISRRCGRTSIRARHDTIQSDSSRRAGVTGESWSNETHPLLAPEEAARLFARDDALLRQLVLIAGRDPMILQRAFYDQHELFHNLVTKE